MPPTPERKKQRVRSPAYPSIDLRTAIEKAEVVYQHEKRAWAPVNVVISHCGYDAASSGGQRMASALKQFGLVVDKGENEDRQMRLSELALDIILAESDGSAERLAAIKKAALGPRIHAQIWEQYAGELPSNQSLKAYLVRQMEFNDVQVDRFIKEFLSTISFARLDEEDIIDAEDQLPTPAKGAVQLRPFIASPSGGSSLTFTNGLNYDWLQPNPGRGAAGSTNMRELPITLPSLNVAVLRLPCPMSESDFDALTASLKAFKAALIKPPSSPAPSEDIPDEEPDDA